MPLLIGLDRSCARSDNDNVGESLANPILPLRLEHMVKIVAGIDFDASNEQDLEKCYILGSILR